MRRLAIVAVTLAVVACSTTQDDVGSTSSSTVLDARTIATIRLSDYGPQMQALSARGHDIAGVDVATREVDVVVDAEELQALRDEGFEVLRETNIPQGVAPETEYKNPRVVEELVRQYVERYPSLASAVSVGRSVQGRDIWAVRISSSAQHDPKKPVIFYNGMHHARELMTAEVPLDTIDTLLTGYGTDPKITHWVDANEIWVLPMFNVDGSNQVWSGDSFWRKNARGCPATGSCASRTGVDLNRNYPYGWGSCNGSSASASADNYRGPVAASEPETQAMMGFVDRIRPVFDISYHSYSELVLYPYGCQGQHAQARALYQDLGAKMAAGLPSDDSPSRTYKHGTPWELLYSADGGDMDWMYSQFNVMAFAIEVNSSRPGFRPSYAGWRTKTVTKLRSAWQLLLDRAEGSGIRGVVAAPNAKVTVGGVERAVNPDGSFHYVLQPGTYPVTVRAPGRPDWSQTITVGDTRVDVTVD